MSEGSLIWEMMRILGFSRRTKLSKAKTKGDAIERLKRIAATFSRLSGAWTFYDQGSKLDPS